MNFGFNMIYILVLNCLFILHHHGDNQPLWFEIPLLHPCLPARLPAFSAHPRLETLFRIFLSRIPDLTSAHLLLSGTSGSTSAKPILNLPVHSPLGYNLEQYCQLPTPPTLGRPGKTLRQNPA